MKRQTINYSFMKKMCTKVKFFKDFKDQGLLNSAILGGSSYKKINPSQSLSERMATKPG